MKRLIIFVLFLCLFSTTVRAETYSGVDISDYQGSISWSEAAADGIEFAMIKATEGNSLTESTFYTNVSGANANGIAAGAYHYARFTSISDAKSEAEHFLSVISSADITYAVALDLEANPAGLSAGTLSQAALAFCEKVASAGYTVLIYSSQNFFQTELDMDALNSYGFWVAKYSSDAPVIDHVMWQYTSTGAVSGISGDVDLNYAYEDFANGSGGGSPSTDSVSASIQQTLNSRYNTGLTVDGIIGTQTKKAMVKGVQTELNKQFGKGLVVDGLYGPKTKSAFVNVRYGAQGNLTYLIQAALYSKGFDTGGVDAIFGSKTRSAVRQFQSDNGLSVDGIVGENTAYTLFRNY